jgi:beta-lactamase class D
MNPAALLLSCVAILNTATGQVSRTTGQCDVPLSPASTFKIPHALLALETGVVTPASVERWDGTRHPAQPLWDQDHTVLSAMRPSVLWFFQRIAPRIGAARMQPWLKSLGYGNADTSGPITEYWINGRLRVSVNEQLAFLSRFYAGDLPVAAAHIAAVREALDQKPGTIQNARGVHPITLGPDVQINAKTGATTLASGEAVSWLVGQATVKGTRHVFAGAAWAASGGVDQLDGVRAVERALTAKGMGR